MRATLTQVDTSSEFCLPFLRAAPGFELRSEEENPAVTPETLLTVKIILLQVLEKRLPVYLF